MAVHPANGGAALSYRLVALMTHRPAYEALKAAFFDQMSAYVGAEDLAADCAEIALEALEEADIISERDLNAVAIGDLVLYDTIRGA